MTEPDKIFLATIGVAMVILGPIFTAVALKRFTRWGRNLGRRRNEEMNDCWISERYDKGEWVPRPGMTPMDETTARKHAAESRFDLIPDIFRIARYVRDEGSVKQ